MYVKIKWSLPIMGILFVRCHIMALDIIQVRLIDSVASEQDLNELLHPQ